MARKFVEFDWENELYPPPSVRVKDPQKTAFNPGDVVKIGIGPATGRIGIVAVERNANYQDYEPYAGDEAIGVRVAEQVTESLVLREIISGLVGKTNGIKSVLRWFDDASQLFLLQKAE
jgi:hypothetical protein